MTNPNVNSGSARAISGGNQKDRRESLKDSQRAREAAIPTVPRGWSSEKTEDSKTKLTKLVLMFRTVSGEPRNLSIPAGERENLKKIRRRLLDYDANLPGKESDDLLLIQHLINTVPLIPLSEVDKPGFTTTGKGFVLGASLLGDANWGYRWHEDPNPMSVGAKRGTSKRWDEAAALLAHSSFATLALLTVLASPIARYIELRSTLKRPRGQVISETATFNFVGTSAAGKTLAVAVAASATGNPGNRSKWD